MSANIILDRSVPSYIKTEYPYLVLFLQAYYEYLQQQGYSVDNILNLKKYRVSDTTLDSFITHFHNEYLNKFPSNIAADKKLAIDSIRKFYLNKGNQQSYRFLFRLLYDEDISFYFPGDDVLRASDGKWIQESIIKISVSDDFVAEGMENSFITGKTSGAIAGIESVIVYEERSHRLAEISIKIISGTFILDEKVIINGVEYNTFRLYSGATITEPGSQYKIGDSVTIKDSSDEEIGLASIVSTTRGSVTGLTIEDGGLGYNGEVQNIDMFYALPMNYTWNGMYLPDTPIYSEDSNGYDFASLPMNFTIPTEDIEGIGDSIVITDSSNSSGYGAYGIVTSVDNNGTVTSVEVIDGGYYYELPTAEVVSDTGSGAQIQADGGGGGVRKVRFNTLPIYITGDASYIDFTTKGDGLAEATLNTSIVGTYPGRWLNEDGQLSSNKKLQDNYFYQDFSYVIKISRTVDNWRDYVKNIIHPIGTKVFGEVSIKSKVSLSVSANTRISKYVLRSASNISLSTLAYVIVYHIDSNGDLTPV